MIATPQKVVLVPELQWEGHVASLTHFARIEATIRDDWEAVAAAFQEHFEPSRAGEAGHLAYAFKAAYKRLKESA